MNKPPSLGLGLAVRWLSSVSQAERFLTFVAFMVMVAVVFADVEVEKAAFIVGATSDAGEVIGG